MLRTQIQASQRVCIQAAFPEEMRSLSPSSRLAVAADGWAAVERAAAANGCSRPAGQLSAT